jgi:hypothetical protein
VRIILHQSFPCQTKPSLCRNNIGQKYGFTPLPLPPEKITDVRDVREYVIEPVLDN